MMHYVISYFMFTDLRLEIHDCRLTYWYKAVLAWRLPRLLSSYRFRQTDFPLLSADENFSHLYGWTLCNIARPWIAVAAACLVIATSLLLSVLWIQIRADPHLFGNLDPHPDAHKKFWNRIRIKIYKLDPEPDLHQFADFKPKCTYGIWAYFSTF